MGFACNGATTWAGPLPPICRVGCCSGSWRIRSRAAALGGLDKTTLRVIRQPKGQTPGSPESGLFEARIPTTREGADLRAGAMFVREWKGKLERVTVLEKGFAWNGKSYASLSQIAKRKVASHIAAGPKP